MSFHTGKMGIAGGISLIYMITFPFIFLTTPAQIIEGGAGLGWLIPLIGGSVTIIMLLALTYILGEKPADMYSLVQKLIGNTGAMLVSLYYAGVFFFDAALLLRQFAENTLLTALPKIEFSLVVLIYSLVAAIIIYAGLEGMVRANYIITPFAVSALILVLLLLTPFYNIYNLMPWQGTGLETVIPAGLTAAGAQAGTFALIILAPAFQNTKTIRQSVIFGLGLSILLKALTIFVFLLVFDIPIAREKVLSFFEMARLVYLSRYVQRIESLFIILWVMSGVLAIAINLYMGIYLITRLLKLPSMRPLVPLVGAIAAELAMLPPDITSVIILDMVAINTFFNIGVYIIPIILIAAWLWKKKKRRAARC